MLSARPAALSALLLLAALGAVPHARAQPAADVAQARDLFMQGSARAREGKWDEARELYARSLSLKRAPITLYSLGIAQKNTGRMVEALENLRAFLAEPSVAATQPYEQPAREAIAQLEAKVARITLRVEPAGLPGVWLRIDGTEVPPAALGVSRPADPGEHEIVAGAPGRRQQRTRVTLAEAGSEEVTVTLPRAPDDAAASVPPAAREAAPEAPSRVLPVVLIVGGAALLATGITVGLIGVDEASEAPASEGPEADAARVKMITGDVVGAAGIVAAAAGVVVWLVHGAPPPSRPAAGRRAWIGPGGAGLRVRF